MARRLTWNDLSRTSGLIEFTVIPSMRRTGTGVEESASVTLSEGLNVFRIEVVP
jgi:hypothetical protein